MFFWKMSGTGNDFIIVNNIKEQIPLEKFPIIARKLCERHLSVGADGIMVVERAASEAADIRAVVFNADGSEAEMCGNGIRCIARYAWEEKLAANPVRIEAKAGYTEVERLSRREYKVKLQNATLVKPEASAMVNGRTFAYTYLELGDPGLPHIVVPIKNLRNADRDILRIDGRSLRNHSDFSRGANVNFYQKINGDTVELLTYERGVEDFTYACGTGSGSTALVLRLQNIVSADVVKLRVPGGLLKVELVKNKQGSTDGGNYDIFLSGDTNIVYKGDLYDEDFMM